MAEIIWEDHQEDHIHLEHGVSAEAFDDAWHDPGRWRVCEDWDPKYGRYYKDVGVTRHGRAVVLIWRWQNQDVEADEVWPITAYFSRDDQGS